MTFITCAGAPVMSGELVLPESGAWWASLELPGEEVLTGRVVITDESNSFIGTVLRSSVVAGRVSAVIVGGNGGRGVVSARSYQGTQSFGIAQAIASSAGEVLDPSSARWLTGALPYWTTAGGSLGQAMSLLCEALGLTWRILPGGMLWVGRDEWSAGASAQVLDEDGALGALLVATDELSSRPGTTVAGARITRVEYELLPSSLRATLWRKDG